MAKATSIRLLLMRAGATDWDQSQRVQGATDLPMSPNGLAAAQQHIAALGKLNLSKIVCAPDEASVATTQLLAQATGAKTVVVPELADMHLGLWEGLLFAELEERYCRAGRQWLEDPSSITPPEGETLDSFQQRVMPALHKVVGKFRGNGALGVVLRPIALGLVRCALNGMDTDRLWEMVKDRPAAEWYDVLRDEPRLTPQPRQPRRTAAAA